MRMLAGIMRSTSGQMLYDGVPIRTLGEGYRDVFGFLPGEFCLQVDFGIPGRFTSFKKQSAANLD